MFRPPAGGAHASAPVRFAYNCASPCFGPRHDPDWSPDGTRIAFESYLDGKSEVYVVNSDGSGLTRLTKSPAR